MLSQHDVTSIYVVICFCTHKMTMDKRGVRTYHTKISTPTIHQVYMGFCMFAYGKVVIIIVKNRIATYKEEG